MDFAFKHMDRSPAVEQSAKDAFEGVFAKMGQKPTSSHTTFSVNSKFKSVHLSAHLPDGIQIELEHADDNMYKVIDAVAVKLERELRRRKNKLISRRGHVVKPQIEEVDYEGEE